MHFTTTTTPILALTLAISPFTFSTPLNTTTASLPPDASFTFHTYTTTFTSPSHPLIPYPAALTLISEATRYLTALERSYPTYNIDKTPIRGQAFLYGNPSIAPPPTSHPGLTFKLWKAAPPVGGRAEDVEPLVFRAVEAALWSAGMYVRGFGGKENLVWSVRVEVRRVGGKVVLADGAIVGDGAVIGGGKGEEGDRKGLLEVGLEPEANGCVGQACG